MKAANASAEDYKTKYDELVADNKRKADEQAARELEAAERAEFDGYFTEQKKEWYNQMTADGYFAKYRAVKTDPANKAKTTADILHNLTKDDSTAFKGVAPEVKLAVQNQPYGLHIRTACRTASGSFFSLYPITRFYSGITRSVRISKFFASSFTREFSVTESSSSIFSIRSQR